LVQHQIQAPQTDAERKAVDCFGQLLASERDCRTIGKAFGHALLALRKEVRQSHSRDFMSRIKQLGISQEKARYWMAKAGGKETDRHKKPTTPNNEETPLGWESAYGLLKELRGKLVFLRNKKERKAFAAELVRLAETLRIHDKKKGAAHAKGILQRKRQKQGSHIAVADGKLAHPSGGRR